MIADQVSRSEYTLDDSFDSYLGNCFPGFVEIR